MLPSFAYVLRCAGAVVALSAALIHSGCSSGGGGLNGPTIIEFRGLTPQDANTIEWLLLGEELRVVRKDGPQGTTFETRDIAWDGIYQPAADAVLAAADRLNRFQFLTVRRYLGVVFAVLVLLLLVLAVWP